MTSQPFATSMQQGIEAAQAGDHAFALKCFQSACQRQPDSAGAHINCGHMALLLKNEQEAERAFLKAVELDASLEEAQLGLARLRLQQKRWPEAKLLLENTSPSKSGHRIYLKAIAHEGLGEISEAMASLQEAHHLGVAEADPVLRRLLAQNDSAQLARMLYQSDRLQLGSVVQHLHQIGNVKRCWIFVETLLDTCADRTEVFDVSARWFLEQKAYAYAARVSTHILRQHPTLNLSKWPGLKECAWLR